MFNPKSLSRLLVFLPPLKLLIWHVTGWACYGTISTSIMQLFLEKKLRIPCRYSGGFFLWNIEELSWLEGVIWYLFWRLALVIVVCCFLYSWKLGKFGLGYKLLHMCQHSVGTKTPWWPWQASPGASCPWAYKFYLSFTPPPPSPWRLSPWIWTYSCRLIFWLDCSPASFLQTCVVVPGLDPNPDWQID